MLYFRIGFENGDSLETGFSGNRNYMGWFSCFSPS